MFLPRQRRLKALKDPFYSISIAFRAQKKAILKFYPFNCEWVLDVGNFGVQGRLRAQVAQSVEQGTENPRVGGSIPSLGTERAAANVPLVVENRACHGGGRVRSARDRTRGL